ncbi:hypothetical protein AX774_g6756 [Zancudomyces culisetae]|uniref:Uncharacterized protein n=1 Tax=Zancudomyces culisetae TaxID=1213189 RepID=A0A1R1PFR3_ZANCU|nr:hypothetical protein AX774_g7856 [Zancudomyces culisetae]OMH79811.1 hypothetical protein AX774_g6756 [Zancudomyces culisetae]|eukprot:OMH78745.1 hypothetical protein AX774_g7856 [Zancudomyces culisetae]
MKSHLEKINTFAKQLKIILRDKDYLISRIKKAQERQNCIEIPNRYHKDFVSLVHTLWYIVSNSTEFIEAHEFLRCYKVDYEQEANGEESRVLRAGRIDRLYHIIEQIEKTISEKKDINDDADIRHDASVQLVRLSEELRDAVQNIQG